MGTDPRRGARGQVEVRLLRSPDRHFAEQPNPEDLAASKEILDLLYEGIAFGSLPYDSVELLEADAAHVKHPLARGSLLAFYRFVSCATATSRRAA
jgi:hypothetical protein